MRLPFRPTALVRPIAFVAVAIAIVYAWHAYRTASAWHVGLPRHLGPLLPIYANASPIDLDVHARRDALTVAISSAIVAALGVSWCVARRYATLSCLLVALVGVWVTNVAVGHLRGDHALFVEPFSRRGLEYHTDVPVVGDDPIAFIKAYPQLAADREISHHAGTHPPGGILFLWAGEKYFGPAPETPRIERRWTSQQLLARRLARFRFASGPPADLTLDAAVWLAVSFTALGVLPAFWLARLAGGAAAARRMLPLYVASPSLILFGATSMDGVFLVINLLALAAGVAAIRTRSRPGSFAWPVVAGVALWLATFMTYAALAVVAVLVFLALLDAIRHLHRREPRGFELALLPEDLDGPGEEDRRFLESLLIVTRCAAVGIVFVICQLIAQRALGYDLRACAESAMRIDLRGLGITGYESRDLWACLSIGNAFALVIGTGVCASALVAVGLLGRLRHPLRGGLARFGLATLLSIVALAASTLFTMETERVWLCLTPVLLITATLAYRGTLIWLLAPLGLIAQAIWIETNFRTWW